MSEDGYGLDKAARLAAQEVEEIEPLMRLEPEFPLEVIPLDLEFFLKG